MDGLTILSLGFICMACFLLGAKVGQSVSKGEDVLRNPIEAAQEHREKREAKQEAKVEQDRLETIMRNIERYDGTSLGQEDVPR